MLSSINLLSGVTMLSGTKRRTLLITGGSLLALFVVVFAAWASGVLGIAGSETFSTAILVRRGSMEARVRARGELEAVKAYPVAVPQVPTGALKVARLVPEGSMVATGDVLVEFDATQLEIELDNNMASFRGTDRRIDRNRIQSGIEAGSIGVFKSVAELEMEVAEAVKIDDGEIFSRREILDASLDKDYASKKIVFADLSLLLRGKYYDIDEGILKVQRKQVSDRIDRVKTSLATLILRSPGSGMVVYRKNWRGATVSIGSSVWPGNVLMQLVDPSTTALKVYVPEKYATGLEAGQAATVRVDAFADHTYEGKIASVSKLSRPISQRSPVKYFEAQITLNEPDPDRLRPGMEGEGEILVGKTGEDALIVPRAAVRVEGEESFVYVAGAAGAPERRQVKLGLGDLVRVTVESGLSEGEHVMLGEVDASAGAAGGEAEEGKAAGAPAAGKKPAKPPVPEPATKKTA
jgi:multidrug efflux pump subunit AcrA (membrane-fusion protein)